MSGRAISTRQRDKGSHSTLSYLRVGLAQLLLHILLCTGSKRRKRSTVEVSVLFSNCLGVGSLVGDWRADLMFLPNAWNLSIVKDEEVVPFETVEQDGEVFEPRDR